jgi:IS30 family transposase
MRQCFIVDAFSLISQESVPHLNSGQKTAADAARLFNVHPSTVSRIPRRGKVP